MINKRFLYSTSIILLSILLEVLITFFAVEISAFFWKTYLSITLGFVIFCTYHISLFASIVYVLTNTYNTEEVKLPFYDYFEKKRLYKQLEITKITDEGILRTKIHNLKIELANANSEKIENRLFKKLEILKNGNI